VENWLDFGVQIAIKMGWIPIEFVGAVVLGVWGIQLYSAVKKPSGTWDEFLKGVSVALMIVSVIGLLVAVSQLLSGIT
jgi:hypothetical protein